MSHADVLDTLVKQPDAFKIMERATSVLEKEKEARQQFYELVHEDINAEFINGEVVMYSPVKLEHWDASMNLSGSLNHYVKQHKLGKIGVEKVMIRLTRNDYEPDICFFGKEKVARFQPGQMLFPAPDFVVETLSPTTEKNDRTIKLQDYAAHGVTEYWIIDPVQQSIEQYFLENNQYTLQAKLVKEGTIHSKAVAGYVVSLQEVFGPL